MKLPTVAIQSLTMNTIGIIRIGFFCVFVASCSDGHDSSNLADYPPPMARNMCELEEHPAIRNNHKEVGQVDLCEYNFPRYAIPLTNWGTKPEWINSSSFVFLSNQVGEVYKMDILSGEIQWLSGHFSHAGFNRVHVLANGDLLLVGPSDGPRPPSEPLVEYSVNYYNGDMFILKAPYDSDPIPLHQHAWEGVAVSKSAMRIAWSNTEVPFWQTAADGSVDLIKTIEAYVTAKSDIYTGDIVYDAEQVPSLQNIRVVVQKSEVGNVFLEPQDFAKGDSVLLFSIYGPAENLGDAATVEIDSGAITRFAGPMGDHYEEWEGVHPSGNSALIELNLENELFDKWTYVDLYTYDFDEEELSPFAVTQVGAERYVEFFPHEPVYSPDGSMVLTTVGGVGSVPGYGVGIVLFSN